MFLCAGTAGDLPVGDITQQDMVEGVLRVGGDGGTAFASHEVLPLQGAEETLCLADIEAGRGCYAAEPEDLAVHGGLLQELLLGPWQRVEPRGDHTLYR